MWRWAIAKEVHDIKQYYLPKEKNVQTIIADYWPEMFLILLFSAS